MKVEWYWLAVAFAVAWYWSRQREQNLVTMNAAATYRAQHPIEEAATAPPGVDVAKLMKAATVALGSSPLGFQNQPPGTNVPKSASYIIA